MLFLSQALHIPQVCIISKTKQLNQYHGAIAIDARGVGTNGALIALNANGTACCSGEKDSRRIRVKNGDTADCNPSASSCPSAVRESGSGAHGHRGCRAPKATHVAVAADT